VAISMSSQTSNQEIATSACCLLAMTLLWAVVSQEPSPLGEDSPAVRAPTSHPENINSLCELCGSLRAPRPSNTLPYTAIGENLS